MSYVTDHSRRATFTHASIESDASRRFALETLRPHRDWPDTELCFF